jgi:hypothetical protein
MILNQLGIFGWKLADENLVLASLLTGDPLLLIGSHGCAKTHVANKVAQALGRKFLVYDASKAMFEDVLGYPNVEKLKHGVVEYVPSPVTIWDKELVFIDELNRAVPELQSKWLEIIRSRKIMGFPTQVKWVWAAMNPMGYAGANLLDAALAGRFAFFLYPPDVLQMDEEDRIKVAMHINGDDAPSLREWTGGATASTVSHEDTREVGEMLGKLLPLAGQRFLQLRSQMQTLPEFLAKFADLLARETRGEVSLDGRRLGFVHRNLLANRAIELARADLFGDALPDFVQSARYVVQSSIPVALDGEGIKREEAVHKFEICFDLLSGYFAHNAELGLVNLVYELFTTKDLMRRAELLLTENLGELAVTKAWSDLLKEDKDITLLAYTALQVEARRPGTVPRELLAALSGKMGQSRLSTECIPRLEDDNIEYIAEVEALLRQDSELAALVAYGEVAKLVSTGHITPERLSQTQRRIKEGIQAFVALLEGTHRKGGKAA